MHACVCVCVLILKIKDIKAWSNYLKDSSRIQNMEAEAKLSIPNPCSWKKLKSEIENHLKWTVNVINKEQFAKLMWNSIR